MHIQETTFGCLPDGHAVTAFELANDAGMRVRVLTYGGIIQAISVPDRDGGDADVVLGFDTLDDYLQRNPYFGCITGRFANRIAGATFDLGGKTYRLAANDGRHHLHGGRRGFDKVIWNPEPKHGAGRVSLVLSHLSEDGDEGYPGNLHTTVTYTLTADNRLIIDYGAETDADTILNLTNHSYFNLTGDPGTDILDHVLTLNADTFTPTDSDLIPAGAAQPVAGTPLDFRTPCRIGARIDTDTPCLRAAGGYDHNFIVTGASGELRPAAAVIESRSGRRMDVLTTEPAIQLYTANMLPDGLPGKAGAVYRRRAALCLETQHFPDSPNRPDFPSVVLAPGQRFSSQTVYAFSVV